MFKKLKILEDPPDEKYHPNSHVFAIPLKSRKNLEGLMMDYFTGENGFLPKYFVDFDTTGKVSQEGFKDSYDKIVCASNRPTFFMPHSFNSDESLKKEKQDFKEFFSVILNNYLLEKEPNFMGWFPIEFTDTYVGDGLIETKKRGNDMRMVFNYPFETLRWELTPEFLEKFYEGKLSEMSHKKYYKKQNELANKYVGLVIELHNNFKFSDYTQIKNLNKYAKTLEGKIEIDLGLLADKNQKFSLELYQINLIANNPDPNDKEDFGLLVERLRDL